MVINPSTGAGQTGPAFISTKLPVPKVTLVMPGVEAGLAEEGGVLVTGHPADGHARAAGSRPPSAVADTRPNRPHDGRTSGRVASGTPKRSHSSADHRRTTMSKSRVREALVASVANTPPSGASGQVPQHPGVDGAEGQVRGPVDSPPWSSSHCILVAEK